MGFKEQYWRYSLIVIILLMGVVIFFQVTPFLGGVLGASTIYILLRRQAFYLTEQRHFKRSIMAICMLLETILIFLVPLALLVWLVVSQLQAVNLNPHSLLAPVEQVTAFIREKTGYDVLSSGNVQSMISILPKVGQAVMGGIGSFAVNVLVLLLVLYFMLTGGRRMEAYIGDILPFNKRNKKEVLHEFHMVVRSNAIGVPLLAILQGAVAMLGYYIFGAPGALLWGIVSCFATIIPVVGTAIIWIPLVVYLAINGSWGYAIGLAAYCIVIVSNVDNLIRSVLQKKMADTHPLITIFGVVIGLPLFGFMGVIFGPLLLAIFVLCVKIFKAEYLEGK
ncbi:MAG: AI-2E family transporter [Odoribacter splanchnicus]|nr:AI-2E family transporter [Odoribacter splanchnicus]